MPNQIPFNYYQNTPMPNLFETNQPSFLNQTGNESNIMYKLNELEQKIKNLEIKINELTKKESNYYDNNYKTSMHMM